MMTSRTNGNGVETISLVASRRPCNRAFPYSPTMVCAGRNGPLESRLQAEVPRKFRLRPGLQLAHFCAHIFYSVGWSSSDLFELAEAGLEPTQDSTGKTANSKGGGAESGAAGAGRRRTPFWPNLSPYGQMCSPGDGSCNAHAGFRLKTKSSCRAPAPQFRRRSRHSIGGGHSSCRTLPPPVGDTMNQSTPALPTSHRDTRGQACVKSLMGIKRRTGVTMPKPLLLKMAFDSGYEAAQRTPAAANCWSRPWICGMHCLTWMAKRSGPSRWTSWRWP